MKLITHLDGHDYVVAALAFVIFLFALVLFRSFGIFLLISTLASIGLVATMHVVTGGFDKDGNKMPKESEAENGL